MPGPPYGLLVVVLFSRDSRKVVRPFDLLDEERKGLNHDKRQDGGLQCLR